LDCEYPGPLITLGMRERRMTSDANLEPSLFQSAFQLLHPHADCCRLTHLRVAKLVGVHAEATCGARCLGDPRCSFFSHAKAWGGTCTLCAACELGTNGRSASSYASWCRLTANGSGCAKQARSAEACTAYHLSCPACLEAMALKNQTLRKIDGLLARAHEAHGHRIARAGTKAFPRLIHQSYRSAALPDNFAAWRASWIRHHPHFQHRFWSDEENRELVRSRFPWLLPLYDGLLMPIMRADAVRYLYLYEFGGIYADLDFLCLQSFESLLRAHEHGDDGGRRGGRPADDVLLARIALHATGRRRDGDVPNALMISRRRAPFWLLVLRLLVERFACNGSPSPMQVTGPALLSRAVGRREAWHAVGLVNASLWYPINWADARWRGLAPRNGRMSASSHLRSAASTANHARHDAGAASRSATREHSLPESFESFAPNLPSIEYFNASALANAGLIVPNVSLAVTFWTHSWGGGA
jgi:mannosyltransferase OCH1-like enzyme